MLITRSIAPFFFHKGGEKMSKDFILTAYNPNSIKSNKDAVIYYLQQEPLPEVDVARHFYNIYKFLGGKVSFNDLKKLAFEEYDKRERDEFYKRIIK